MAQCTRSWAAVSSLSYKSSGATQRVTGSSRQMDRSSKLPITLRLYRLANWMFGAWYPPSIQMPLWTVTGLNSMPTSWATLSVLKRSNALCISAGSGICSKIGLRGNACAAIRPAKPAPTISGSIIYLQPAGAHQIRNGLADIKTEMGIDILN